MGRVQTVGHLATTTFVVVVLLSAAGLKIHSSVGEEGYRSLPISIASGEILLSILLLVRPTRNLSWIAAGCLFASFAVFNAYQWLAGISSCGCFGDLEFAPTSALFLDLTALALIVAFPSQETVTAHVSRCYWIPSQLRSILALLLFCLPAGIVLTRAVRLWDNRSAKEIAPGVREGRDVLILAPARWLAHQLPIASNLDSGDLITKGEWELWFVDPECAECEDALIKLKNSLFYLPPRRIALVLTRNVSRISHLDPFLSDFLVLHLVGPKRIECPIPTLVICRDLRVEYVRYLSD